jgi:ABC-type glutathione transport system ATPase component
MTTADVAPVLEVANLRKVYPTRGGQELVAVDDVSFTVPRGGSLAIVGESGSGKTTIAKMLVGLEPPTGGRILINGQDRSRSERGARARRQRGREVQIVFQDPYTSLDRRQTVGSCLAEVLRLHFDLSSEEVTRRVEGLTGQVGLDARQVRARPGALSGGQRQRVAIARALAAEPTVMILDESVAALDVSIQAQVLNLLADIRDSTGISYVLISHDLAVVRQITDDVVVMHRGKVVERGPTGRVLDHPEDPYTRLLRDSVPRPGWQPVSRRLATPAPERS